MFVRVPDELNSTYIDRAVLGVSAIPLATFAAAPACDAETVHVAPGFSCGNAEQLVLAVIESVNELLPEGVTTKDAPLTLVSEEVTTSPLPEVEYKISWYTLYVIQTQLCLP